MESATKKARLEVPNGVREADQVGHPAIILHFQPAESNAKPKVLEYFAVPGLAEIPKLMLEVTSTPYDAVLHFDAQSWKERAPFGQLPTYHGEELRGMVLSESRAICHHLARITGLSGKDIVEQARVNQLFELAEDIDSKKSGLFDTAHSDAMRLRTFMSAAEASAPEIGSLNFVGDALTLADVAMFRVCYKFVELLPNCLASYPKLHAFVQAFATKPEMASYLASERRLPHCHNEVGDRPYERTAAGFKYVRPISPSACQHLWNNDS